jgi:hypothetical protein
MKTNLVFFVIQNADLVLKVSVLFVGVHVEVIVMSALFVDNIVDLDTKKYLVCVGKPVLVVIRILALSVILVYIFMAKVVAVLEHMVAQNVVIIVVLVIEMMVVHVEDIMYLQKVHMYQEHMQKVHMEEVGEHQ